MELRHIRYFIAAAEELNFSRASRRMNVSQPAMSRLIHDLECELGAPLFVRERFGLSLTAAGEKYQVYARQILDICSEAMLAIRNLPEIGTILNIGFFYCAKLGPLLGEAIRLFREIHPDIIVKTHELSPAAQAAALRKKQIDLALLGNPGGAVLDEFMVKYLFEVELQAVLPAQHPLAGRQAIYLKDLERDAFIGYNEQSFPGRNQVLYNRCWVAGFKPNLRYQGDSLLEVLSLIGAGNGVCLMPADVARMPHSNIVFVPVREKLEPIKFAAAWRRDDERVMLRHLLDSTIWSQ